MSQDVALQIFNEPILGQSYDNPRQLIKDISAYPLKDLKFALAYKALSQKFNDTLIYRWQESIATNVDKMQTKFYKHAQSSKIVTDLEDLNPFIVRFLKCIQQVEVGHLHSKFKAELTNYLHFLLKFANREESFRKTPIYRDKKLNTINLNTSLVALLHIEVGLAKVRNK